MPCGRWMLGNVGTSTCELLLHQASLLKRLLHEAVRERDAVPSPDDLAELPHIEPAIPLPVQAQYPLDCVSFLDLPAVAAIITAIGASWRRVPGTAPRRTPCALSYPGETQAVGRPRGGLA